MTPADIRVRWNVPPAAPLVLYTGTFEAYQGLDLLLRAAALLARTHPSARVLVVGGEPAQVEAARAEAERHGAASIVVFTGQQPAREIPAFVAACDILVSPRIRGTNTPLKIYSYLRSGKPIVATDLLTHTQVLSAGRLRGWCRLTPAPFAAAIAGLDRSTRGAGPAVGGRRGTRRVAATAASRMFDVRPKRIGG